ncbi:MAG TPA: small multi-drug export protein [Symbiobacteriaceae bacterium]|nr:small multi-drug export protein [Symbiobacteriaceae bacterium]
MLQHVIDALAGLPRELIVILIAALPLVELRGAIPVGVALKLPLLAVFVIAILGNLLPIPFLLLLLTPLRRVANDWPFIGPIMRWAERRALRHRESIEKGGFWALLLFVGVPLPGTGAWTGAAIAAFLEMRFWRAFAAIFLGVCLAGVIMAILSQLGLMVLTA